MQLRHLARAEDRRARDTPLSKHVRHTERLALLVVFAMLALWFVCCYGIWILIENLPETLGHLSARVINAYHGELH